MQAVVSTLDPRTNREIEALWDELEVCCRLHKIRLTPLPHLSWQVADRYDLGAVGAALDKLRLTLPPFEVRTAGLGIFCGKTPVLYLTVIKDRHLLDMHQAVWNVLHGHGQEVSPHYAPEAWVPHITLAHGATSSDQIAGAVQTLTGMNFSWRVRIDSLDIVEQQRDEVGSLLKRFPLM